MVNKRALKQLIYGSMYLGFLFFLSYGIFSIIKPRVIPAATPLPVEPIRIESVEILAVSFQDYDVLVVMRNPNFNYGAVAIEFTLSVFGPGNILIHREQVSSFLLPGERKFIPVSPLRLEGEITRAEARINHISWNQLKEFIDPAKLFIVRQQTFEQTPQRLTAVANINNISAFDFEEVEVAMILQDPSGRPIAAGSSILNTVRSGTNRGVEIIWPGERLPPVAQLQIQVSTNVFLNQNFISPQTKGTEPFQQFF